MVSSRAKKHVCKECAKDRAEERVIAFHNPADLEAHMIKKHNADELECKVDGCGKTFKAPRTLKRHMKEQHEGELFSCDNCDFSCPRRENMKRHEKSCSRRHGQNGRVDNDTAMVSAAVPPLPSPVPWPSAVVNNPTPDTMFMSRSTSLASSGLATDPYQHFFPATPAESPKDMWQRLWYLAIARAAAQHPDGCPKILLDATERAAMETLITEHLRQGKVDYNVVQEWHRQIDAVAALNFGLSDLMPDELYK